MERIVLVQAVAVADPTALLADLNDLGMQGSTQFGAIVSGRIPLDALDDMAALRSLQFASPTARPQFVRSPPAPPEGFMASKPRPKRWRPRSLASSRFIQLKSR